MVVHHWRRAAVPWRLAVSTSMLIIPCTGLLMTTLKRVCNPKCAASPAFPNAEHIQLPVQKLGTSWKHRKNVEWIDTQLEMGT